ncbi:MAG: helicase HerA-like domain-containing protein [Acidimicrobiia bacterium]
MATKKSAEKADDFSPRIAEAYATDGPSIVLGAGMHDGEVFPEAVVQIPLAMTNRHGLIAGATGTGKTVTLQILAEQLAAAGVAVFAADMKGDLSGLMQPMEPNEKIDARVETLGIDYAPEGHDVTFWSLGGLGEGIPLRASVSSFGPELLAKVLGSNETQRSSLALVFAYADQHQMALLDLSDLRALLAYLTSDEGKDELKGIGGVSPATAGVLLRGITELEQQGGEAFFGVPEAEITSLLDPGAIHLLELPAVQDRPALFSTFLMYLIAELFQELPEVGDLDKPKLVFFFDEAHLLFNDASKAFIEQVAQTVRLIRSKGVGVYFITQLPDDVPAPVLAQLGNRVQHALRAHTPRDAKALKAAVTTYPKTDDYDLEEDMTSLGIGEAMITILDEKGTPTPVVWTHLRPPLSKIGDAGRDTVDAAAKANPLFATYATEENRESAEEKIKARLEGAAAAAEVEGEGGVTVEKPEGAGRAKKSTKKTAAPKKDEPGVVETVLKSREGRSMLNTVLRGVFGILKKS